MNDSESMRASRTKMVTGLIEVQTGLHIGAGSDTIEIGGMDDPIIRHPVTDEPYIPGSSLKGKMRSLMEWYLGKVGESQGEPCKCGECEICRVFGSALQGTPDAREKARRRGPTRLLVRDAFVTDKTREKFADLSLVEEKSENSIDRITAEATPRRLERVVPGAGFGFEIAYRIIDRGDDGATDEKDFSEVVLKALALLQRDYLGGGGSRGSGKVSFTELKDEKGQPVSLPEV